MDSSSDGKSGRADGTVPAELAETAVQEDATTQRRAPRGVETGPAHPSTEPWRSFYVGELVGGRYRLLHETGKGAEGVVYRALDVTADVVVALKILQHEGPHLMGRLRRELRVARRVTHPNVVRLYDLIQVPGLLGLSMEFVEGESLEDRLQRAGALAGPELLSLAHDLARGLAAAHAAGVTHRDLKPANVILRADGSGATITDFGIARLHDAATDSNRRGDVQPSSAPLTVRGALVGTPIYMAPEQLEGRTDVGPAADVYAFGLVVREAATLVCLHDDAKTLDELRRRRSSAPPPLEPRPELPPALARVVERCLASRPQDRYANGDELAQALGLGKVKRPRAVWPAAAIASSVLLLSTGLFAWRSRPARLAGSTPPAERALALHVSEPKRITFGDCDEYPSFTRDGKSVVYDSTEGKNSNIQVVDLSNGSTRPLTHSDGWDYAATVSPDGRWLAFYREADGTDATFVMPFDGSAPPRQLVQGDCRPAWSSDGRTLWAGPRRHVSRFDVETGRAEETLPTGAESVVFLRELAPGRRLALLAGTEDNDPAISTVAFQSGVGVLRTLASGSFWELALPTPDSRYAILSKQTVDSSDLVAYALDGSGPIPIHDAQVHATSADLSADQRHLVWSTCAPRSSVARLVDGVPVAALREVGEWSTRHLSAIPGSNRVVALSVRSGQVEPWILEEGGKEPARMLATGLYPVLASASPDGWLAMQSARGGIAIMPLDGSSPPRMLTTDAADSAPSFRRGGQEILFSRRTGEGTYEILRVARAGGSPVRLIGPGAREAAAFPTDDRVVYLSGATGSDLFPRVFDPTSATSHSLSVELGPGQWRAPFVSEDGRRVALFLGERELVEVEVESGRVLHRVSTGEALSGGTYMRGGPLFMRRTYKGSLLLADATWQ